MKYSKISTIELINFMSFKKAKVAFDETGIINIKGYNDSGKSAVLRGLAVCLMDMFKRSQAKFIRYGEEYFRIVVTFEDGVSILRDKYLNGQSLYELYKNGERLFTTKQGNKLVKVDGVPQVIQDYLGLCVTDSVYLNYQSCVDKLPVVDTTGSENYQMFHEVLRMEEIYRANNMINTDKNELGSRIAEIEASIQRDEVLLERCGDVTKEFIEEIEKLEDIAKDNDKRSTMLDGMKDICTRYENTPNIPDVEKVSCDRLRAVENIRVISDKFESLVEIPRIEKVSCNRLSKLLDILEAINHVDGFISIPEVPRVDTKLVDRRIILGQIVKVYKDLLNQKEKCDKIDSDLEAVKSELDALMEEANNQGIKYTRCENCGSYTLVGGVHSHE